jgi:hypothetical protein
MGDGHYWVQIDGRGYFRFESHNPPKSFTHQHLHRANCFASAEDAWHVAEQLKHYGREASVVQERPAPPSPVLRCCSRPNGCDSGSNRFLRPGVETARPGRIALGTGTAHSPVTTTLMSAGQQPTCRT